MVEEELEIRRRGETPSKEFLAEKKRRKLEEADKIWNDQLARQKRTNFKAQDKQLEDIDEINKMHQEMGVPKIRTEIRMPDNNI